jgi:hypothetical protein
VYEYIFLSSFAKITAPPPIDQSYQEAEFYTIGGLLSWSFLKLALPLCLPKEPFAHRKVQETRLCLFVYDPIAVDLLVFHVLV